MQKSRLIEVLRSMPRREMQQLGKFLASPYHNTRTDVTRLYEHVRFAFRENLEETLDKKYTYAKVFPNQVYKAPNMLLVMSRLLQLTEDFLVIEQCRRDVAATSLYLAELYRQRKLPKSFRHTIKTAHNQQEKTPSYSTTDQFRASMLQELNYQFQLEENRQGERDLQAWHDTLHHFLVAEVLRQNCILLMHNRLSKQRYQSPLLNDILQFIHTQPELLDIPAIFLYYHSYRMLSEEGDNDHFRQLKSGIIRYGEGFRQRELREVYLLAINYCIWQKNKKNNDSFLRELFDLYQVGLEQEAFIENGFLSRWTYKNVVTAGLLLKEFEWVEGFISTYESKLEKKYRKDSFTYNLAFLYYCRKLYDKAISQLQQVKFDDVFLNLDARNLLLKIYLELKEYEALDAHLNSFEIFIRRKNISNPHKANYLNTIKLSRKIIQLNPYDKGAKAALVQEIETEKNSSTRAFLLYILK